MSAPLRTLALAALLSSTALPALAEITPAEVWDDWQRQISATGVDLVVGDEEQGRDSLRLTDITISAEIEDEDGTLNATIPEILFEARGDGTVEITLSDAFPIDFTGQEPETSTPIAFTVVSRQPGLVTIASREGDVTRYDYIAPTIGATVENMRVDDEPIDIDIDIEMTGARGDYELVEGVPRRFDSSMTFDNLAMTFDGTDPDDPSVTFDFDLAISDGTTDVEGTVAGLSVFDDLSSLVASGFDSTWSLEHGAATYSIQGAEAGSRFNLATTAESGSFDGVISSEGLGYGVTSTGIDVAISSSDLPFPQLTFSMEESETRLALPVLPGEDASNFGLVLRFVGLEVSDALWGMFDPMGQLPRDPATLVIDLAGTGRWLVDVFDPDVTADMGPGDIPGELETVIVEALDLSVAGAELTGEGAFEFDNTPAGAFAPAPSPFGTMNFELVGGNGLLDTLVGMGLVPQEQAMGARMMLGLFARPGDGPDTLTSTIEVGRDGSVSANGQRIR